MKKNILIIACILTVFSCEINDMPQLSEKEEYIKVMASVGEKTKGKLVAFPYDTISLFGCHYPDSSGANYIYKELCDRGDGDIWRSENRYPVIEAPDKVAYWAVAPYDAKGLTLPSVDDAGAISFSYTLPADISLQQDIIVSSYGPIEGSSESLNLSFRHTLSALSFKIGNTIVEGVITSIGLSGVYGKGEYDDGGWDLSFVDDTGDSFSTVVDKKVDVSSVGESIMPEGEVMFVLPGEMPSGASLVITFVNSEKEMYTLNASIAGMTFEAGTYYSLSVDIPEYGNG